MRGTRRIDAELAPFTPAARVEGAPPFAFATSTHPVRYWLNLKWRSWPARGLVGEAVHDATWNDVRAVSSA